MAGGATEVSDWQTVEHPAIDDWQAVHPAQPPKGFSDQLGDFAGHTWEALKGTVTGPVHAALHPIDTVSNILSDASAEVKKGKEAFDKGDYDRAAEHLKYALPVAGPLLRTMREETDAGDYGAALGDITGTVLGGKALGKLPGAAKAGAESAAALPAKVAEIAKTNPKVIIGAGSAMGAAAGHMAGIPGGGYTGAAAGGLIANSIIDRLTVPPPEILSRLSMSRADFLALPKEAKAEVIQLSDRMQAPAKRVPPPVTVATPAAAIAPDVTEGPGKTIGQLIDEHIAERKAKAANPMLQEDTAGQTDFERGARAAKVPHFAQVLHDAGIPADDMARAGGPEWEMATERTNQVHDVNHGAPSPETRAAIIEQMRALEKSKGKPAAIESAKPEAGPLTNNPKALKLARELAEALQK